MRSKSILSFDLSRRSSSTTMYVFPHCFTQTRCEICYDGVIARPRSFNAANCLCHGHQRSDWYSCLNHSALLEPGETTLSDNPDPGLKIPQSFPQSTYKSDSLAWVVQTAAHNTVILPHVRKATVRDPNTRDLSMIVSVLGSPNGLLVGHGT